MTAPHEAALDLEENEVFDLNAFADLLTNAIDEAEDPESEDVRALVKHYRELGRKPKARARTYVDEQAQEAVMSRNLEHGRAFFLLRDALVKAPNPPKPRPAKPRHNPTDGVVISIASIQIAYSLATLEAHANPTLDVDWQERIAAVATAEAQERALAYLQWLRDKQEGAEPEASDVEKAAARIALGRSPKGAGRKPRLEVEQAPEEQSTDDGYESTDADEVPTVQYDDPAAAHALAEL